MPSVFLRYSSVTKTGRSRDPSRVEGKVGPRFGSRGDHLDNGGLARDRERLLQPRADLPGVAILLLISGVIGKDVGASVGDDDEVMLRLKSLDD